MRRLTPEKLRSKLIFDNELVRSLASRHLGAVRAYASAEDAAAGRELTRDAERQGRACVYDVTFRFPIAVSASDRSESATARIDLLAGGNYPYTDPLVYFVSRPVPWVPHVSTSGTVCIGDGWNTRVTAHLITHLMRQLNFDEPAPSAGSSAFNYEAVRWWGRELKHRPLHQGLDYPMPPAHLTHGSDPEPSAFRIMDDTSMAREAVAGEASAFREIATPLFSILED